MLKVEIIHFENSLASDFKRLNIEWLSKYYNVTPQDLEILDNPKRIIDEGGKILFVRVDGIIGGTAAILRTNQDTVELIKMGVTSTMQGKGIGRILMNSVIEEAKKMKVGKITLETAIPLQAAISLYKKSGFVQTSEEETHPVFGRMTFKMEKILEK
jgi:GNAT superfamily N-acetyltransferase